MAILTETGRWANSIVDEKGRRVFSNGLDAKGRRVFGLAGGGGTAYTRSFSDSIALSESFSRATTKAASDSLTLSETFTKFSAKSVTDAVSSSDTSTKQAGKAVTDAVTMTDSISKALSVLVVNTLTLSEAAPHAISKPLSDSVTVTDNPLISTKGKAINLSDAITLSDVIGKAISRQYSDTVTTSETAPHAASKPLSDAFTVSDSPITSSKGKAVNLSDAITIVDAIGKAISRQYSDLIATSDMSPKQLQKALTEALSLSDTITSSKGKSILLTDSVSLSDLMYKAASLSKLDTITPTDSLSRGSTKIITLYDVIVTSDSIQKYLPSAPTLIGHVELKGFRSLYVYITGSRALSIHLRGDISMPATDQNFTLTIGTNLGPNVSATDADNGGAVLPLTGATIKWGMRKPAVGSANLIYKDNTTGGITITDALNGKFTINLMPADTALLTPGMYFHEAKITDANGKVSRLLTGTITLEGSSL